MAKTKISEYDATAANNTDIDSINIAEGMAPSNVNNAIRELMAHLKDGLGAGTPVYLDDTNDRLGVGTTSPDTTLHIAGGANPTLQLTAYEGTQNCDVQILPVRAELTGSKSIMAFKTNNGTSLNEVMRIDEDGNVGIGTTSPDGRVDIAQDQNTTKFTTPHLALTATNTTNTTGFTGVSYASSNVANYGWTAGALRGTTGNNSSFVFTQHNNSASGTERMRVDGSGNVGIGTSSPSSGLHVKGAGGASWLTLENTTASNYSIVDFKNDSGQRVGYVGTYNGDDAFYLFGARNGPMQFFTNGTECMRLDTNKRLLIGRTSAALGGGNGGNLQIGSGTAPAGMTIHSNTTGTGDIQFADGTSGNASYRGLIRYDHANDVLQLWTAAGERARIDSSGNLQVGFSSYSSLGSSNTGCRLSADGTTNALARGSNGTVLQFYSGSGGAGYISVSGNAASYNTSSDYRLKENVETLSGAITRVKALKPKRFSWIEDGLDSPNVDGFLAHEAQTVVPEAISGTKDAMRDEEYEVTPAVLDDDGNVVTEAVMGTRSVPDYQGIDQSKLVPLLTAALQEAIAKIETLETKVAALESA